MVWRVWWLYILTISTNLLISSFLDIEVIYCQFFFFKLLINQIFLHYVLNAFLYRYFATMISLTYCKIHYFYQPIFFFWFVTDINVLKSISNYIAFFFLSKEHPLNIYYKYQSRIIKKRNALLYLIANCIFASSTPQILPLNDEHTFGFSIFWFIGLRKRASNWWFAAPPKGFLSKHYKPLNKTSLITIIFWILTIFNASYSKNSLASESHIYAFFWTILVLAIFGHVLSLLEFETNFIKFWTKFPVKQAIFLTSEWVSSLLHCKPVQQHGLRFSSTICNLRVNETKIRSRNAFIINRSALGSEKENKKRRMQSLLGLSAEP